MMLATIVSPAAAQQQEVQQEEVQQQSAQYVPATQLLPQSVAGLLRIPNFPKFRQAWDRTLLGQLLDEPFMRPFVEAQRARAKNYLESVGNRVGLRLEDLSELASGEVVVAWLPFEQDKRRPFSLVVVADVRQEQAKAQQAIE